MGNPSLLSEGPPIAKMRFGWFSFETRSRISWKLLIPLLAVGLAGVSRFAQLPTTNSVAAQKFDPEFVSVVVGASRGIGANVAKDLAARGGTLVVAGRSSKLLSSVRDDILETHPKANVKLLMVDLARMQSVKEFGRQLQEKYKKIDLLVLNAGLLGVYPKSENGVETLFQVNHLASQQIVEDALSLLKKAARPRVVQVSSFGSVLNDIDSNKTWSHIATTVPTNFAEAGQQYANTKYANVLFAKGLNARYGSWLTATSVHPGFIMSSLYRDVVPEFLVNFIYTMSQIVAKSEENGANTVLLAALQPNLAGGTFLSSTGHEFHHPDVLKVGPKEIDELWSFSSDALKRINASL